MEKTHKYFRFIKIKLILLWEKLSIIRYGRVRIIHAHKLIERRIDFLLYDCLLNCVDFHKAFILYARIILIQCYCKCKLYDNTHFIMNYETLYVLK